MLRESTVELGALSVCQRRDSATFSDAVPQLRNKQGHSIYSIPARLGRGVNRCNPAQPVDLDIEVAPRSPEQSPAVACFAEPDAKCLHRARTVVADFRTTVTTPSRTCEDDNDWDGGLHEGGSLMSLSE